MYPSNARKYPTLNRVLHCQQAVMRKRHEDWSKVIIQDLHKIATFLWPKFYQLRMFVTLRQDPVHAHARTLLQAMAAGALDAKIRDPALSRVEPTPPPAKRAYFEGCENVQQADMKKMNWSLATLKRLSWKIKWIFAGGRSTKHPSQNLQN